MASASLGMAEEYIPLAAILISLCVAMRMDAVAAIGIMVVGYCVGYGAALLNPFTLFIAQDIAELQQGSGLGYRAIIFWPFQIGRASCRERVQIAGVEEALQGPKGN